MNIKDLLKEVDDRIAFYSTTANDIMASAQSIQTHKSDPYEAQKVLVKGMKVQEIASEYMKLSAQLHSVSLAYTAAEKAGFNHK
jgi:hypothetical protein